MMIDFVSCYSFFRVSNVSETYMTNITVIKWLCKGHRLKKVIQALQEDRNRIHSDLVENYNPVTVNAS